MSSWAQKPVFEPDRSFQPTFNYFHLFLVVFIYFWVFSLTFYRFYSFWSSLFVFDCFYPNPSINTYFHLFFNIIFDYFHSFFAFFTIIFDKNSYTLDMLSDRVGSGQPSGQPGLTLPVDSVVTRYHGVMGFYSVVMSPLNTLNFRIFFLL